MNDRELYEQWKKQNEIKEPTQENIVIEKKQDVLSDREIYAQWQKKQQTQEQTQEPQIDQPTQMPDAQPKEQGDGDLGNIYNLEYFKPKAIQEQQKSELTKGMSDREMYEQHQKQQVMVENNPYQNAIDTIDTNVKQTFQGGTPSPEEQKQYEELAKIEQESGKANIKSKTMNVAAYLSELGKEAGAATGASIASLSLGAVNIFDVMTMGNLPEWVENAREYYRPWIEYYRKNQNAPNPMEDPSALLDPKFYLNVLFSQAPIAAVSMGVGGGVSTGLAQAGMSSSASGIIGAFAGSALPSAGEASYVYDKLIDMGYSKDRALAVYAQTMFGITLLNAVSLDRFLKMSGGKGFLTAAATEVITEMGEDPLATIILKGEGAASWDEVVQSIRDAKNVIPHTIMYSILMGGLGSMRTFQSHTAEEQEWQDRFVEQLEKDRELAKQDAATNNMEQMIEDMAEGKDIKLGVVVRESMGQEYFPGGTKSEPVDNTKIQIKKPMKISEIVKEKRGKTDEDERLEEILRSGDIENIKTKITSGAAKNISKAADNLKNGITNAYKWWWGNVTAPLVSKIDRYYASWLANPNLSRFAKQALELNNREYLSQTLTTEKIVFKVANEIDGSLSAITGEKWSDMNEGSRREWSKKILRFMENPSKYSEDFTQEQIAEIENINKKRMALEGYNKKHKARRALNRIQQRLKKNGAYDLVYEISQDTGVDTQRIYDLAVRVRNIRIGDSIKDKESAIGQVLEQYDDVAQKKIRALSEKVMTQKEINVIKEKHIGTIYPGRQTPKMIQNIYDERSNDARRASAVIIGKILEADPNADVSRLRQLRGGRDYNGFIKEANSMQTNAAIQDDVEVLMSDVRTMQRATDEMAYYKAEGSNIQYVPRYDRSTESVKERISRARKQSLEMGKKRKSRGVYDDVSKIMEDPEGRAFSYELDPFDGTGNTEDNVMTIVLQQIIQSEQEAALEAYIENVLEIDGLTLTEEEFREAEGRGDLRIKDYTRLSSSDEMTAGIVNAFPELEGLYANNAIVNYWHDIISESKHKRWLNAADWFISRPNNFMIHLMLMNPLYMGRINAEQMLIVAPKSIPETIKVIDSYFSNPKKYWSDFQWALELGVITGKSPIAVRTRVGSGELARQATQWVESGDQLTRSFISHVDPKSVESKKVNAVVSYIFNFPRTASFDWIDNWMKTAVSNVMREKANNNYRNILNKINKMKVSDETKQKLKNRWVEKHGTMSNYQYEYVRKYMQKYATVEWMGDYSRTPEQSKKIFRIGAAYYQLRQSTYTALLKTAHQDMAQTVEDADVAMGKMFRFIDSNKEYREMTPDEILNDLAQSADHSETLKILGRYGLIVAGEHLIKGLAGYHMWKRYRYRKSIVDDVSNVYSMLMEDDEINRVMPTKGDFDEFIERERSIDVPVFDFVNEYFDKQIKQIDELKGTDIKGKADEIYEEIGRTLFDKATREWLDATKNSNEDLSSVILGASEVSVWQGVGSFYAKLFGKGTGALVPMLSPAIAVVQSALHRGSVFVNREGEYQKLYDERQDNKMSQVLAKVKKYLSETTYFGNLLRIAEDRTLTKDEKMYRAFGMMTYDYYKQGVFFRDIINKYAREYLMNPIILESVMYDSEGNKRTTKEIGVYKSLLWGRVLEDRFSDDGIESPEFLHAFENMFIIGRDNMDATEQIISEDEYEHFKKAVEIGFRDRDYLSIERMSNIFEKMGAKGADKYEIINELERHIFEYAAQYEKLTGKRYDKNARSEANKLYQELSKIHGVR